MSRKPVIAANWKMNKTPSETGAFFEAFLPLFPEPIAVDIVVAPPFVSIPAAAAAIAAAGSYEEVAIAAQNMSHEASGAFTGEVSAAMLKELGVSYVILGHSERRTLYGEDDAAINRKVQAALAAGLCPILCIGESLEERDAGRLEEVLDAQLEGCLAGIDAAAVAGIVLAYEPVWAIGTGRTASPGQAQEAHAYVRGVVARLCGDEAAAAVRVQYGGSAKPDNAGELIAQPDIDGFLVGGASLDPESFAAIVRSGA